MCVRTTTSRCLILAFFFVWPYHFPFYVSLLSSGQMKYHYKATRVSLHVRKSNGGAIRLYEELLGYKVSGIASGYYSDGEDAFIMEARLPAGEVQVRPRTPCTAASLVFPLQYLVQPGVHSSIQQGSRTTAFERLCELESKASHTIALKGPCELKEKRWMCVGASGVVIIISVLDVSRLVAVYLMSTQAGYSLLFQKCEKPICSRDTSFYSRLAKWAAESHAWHAV